MRAAFWPEESWSGLGLSSTDKFFIGQSHEDPEPSLVLSSMLTREIVRSLPEYVGTRRFVAVPETEEVRRSGWAVGLIFSRGGKRRPLQDAALLG